MSEGSIKASLSKLREQLNNSTSVDAETLEIAQKLEADIRLILDQDADVNSIDSSVDIAMSLEARFETEHPVAAGIVRELINALHKMGI